MQTYDVVKLYLALFNRPPEKEGLEMWYNMAEENEWSMSTLADNMISSAVSIVGSSEEYRDIYPQYYNFDINNEEDVRSVIESIYKTLFDKDYNDDPSGIDGWVQNVLQTKNLGHVVVNLITAADNFVTLEHNGAFEDENIINAVNSYENKTLVSYLFSQKVQTADINKDGVYDLRILKDMIDKVSYTSESLIAGIKTINMLDSIEEYFQTHSNKADEITYTNADFYEIKDHKFPLITIQTDNFSFDAIVDNNNIIIPLIHFGEETQPLSMPYINVEPPEDDATTDNIVDSGAIVDLVDLGI